MAQRCVGIVIGPRNLKAVELSGGFGEVSLERAWLIEVPELFRETVFGLVSGAELKQGLPQELKEVISEGAEVSISLPSELCFYRELEFPFADPKKINQVIRLEAEGYFPFSLEDYLLDYLPPLTQDHSSQVLTFALARGQFSQILSSLNALGLDPAFSGIEGLTLPLLSLHQPGIARLWLELGTQRTILVGAFGVQPFLYRGISFGVGKLFEKLRKELGLSQEQAEQWITQADLSGELREGEKRELKIIGEWRELLLAKVRETLHWCERSRKPGSGLIKFEELILTGNGALLKGIEQSFEQDLKIPTRKFQIPEWIKLSSELEPERAFVLSEALSLALARLRREGRKLINFRKGEFAWKREYQIPYSRLIFPGLLLVLIFALGGLKAFGEYRVKRERSEAIKKEILTEYQALFPGAVPTDPVRQLTQALGVAQSKLTAYQDLLYPSAVLALSAIADQVPEQTYFLLNRYSYSGNKVRLEGETGDFSSAKEIVDRLSKLEFFKKVVLEDSRSVPSGRVNFTIQIELKSLGEKGG